MDNLHYENAPGNGIYAVVRHPMLATYAPWSLAHLFVHGDLAGLIFFVGMLVLSTLDMVHIYMRGATRMPTMPGDLSSWHVANAFSRHPGRPP